MMYVTVVLKHLDKFSSCQVKSTGGVYFIHRVFFLNLIKSGTRIGFGPPKSAREFSDYIFEKMEITAGTRQGFFFHCEVLNFPSKKMKLAEGTRKKVFHHWELVYVS